jgi:hypothetical protein
MGCFLGTALAAGPAAALASTAAELFYERTVMTAADARCGLFTPALGQSLVAAQAQARGAALRAGTDPAIVNDIQRRAEGKAAATACDDPDLALAAGRVRNAFEGYQKLTRMTYPGDLTTWQADRTYTEGSVWRLSQGASFGWDRMVFGLAGREAPGALVAVASFADGQTPYAARLVMRDAGRTPQPYLDRRQADAAGRLPLPARMPPRSLDRSFLAEARYQANPALLPSGAKAGWTFRFSGPAAEALAALDPRESVMVEFVFAGRDGDTVRTAYVEVGDFAAGRAFVRYAAR